MPHNNITLIIDLDRTLIRNDSLHDSLVILVSRNPGAFFYALPWLLRNINKKASFKNWLAERVVPNATLLPYNKDVLNLIQEYKSKGSKVLLATAANHKIAKGVFNHLGLFDDFISTDSDLNLKGNEKLNAILKQTNGAPFIYAGDSKCDLPIWHRAAGAILVSNNKNLADQLSAPGKLLQHFPAPKSKFKDIVKLLRIHQWVKNVLLGIPIIAGHEFTFKNSFDALIAFFSFSAIASSIYIVNDLCDLEADRAHAKKRFRPLADGRINVLTALALSLVFMATGFALAFFVNSHFIYVLFVYSILTFFYSFYWKRTTLLDVFVLSGLYTMRLIAGHVATGIKISSWLLAFCMFIFLSLATVKRCTEIFNHSSSNELEVKGRGYLTSDMEVLLATGVASGFCAVLVFALYINSTEVMRLYRSPLVLWLICPLILYWICRVWILTFRGKLHDDPIVFAVTDKATHLIVLLCGATMLVAHYFQI